MSPIRAWHIILLSNESGKPTSFHMSQIELSNVPTSASSPAAYVTLVARSGDAKDQEIAWLRATMLMAADDLTSWLLDNTDEGFEEQPEIDGPRSRLMKVGDFANSFDPFRKP